MMLDDSDSDVRKEFQRRQAVAARAQLAEECDQAEGVLPKAEKWVQLHMRHAEKSAPD
jgi:hypothetical protein